MTFFSVCPTSYACEKDQKPESSLCVQTLIVEYSIYMIASTLTQTFNGINFWNASNSFPGLMLKSASRHTHTHIYIHIHTHTHENIREHKNHIELPLTSGRAAESQTLRAGNLLFTKWCGNTEFLINYSEIIIITINKEALLPT